MTEVKDFLAVMGLQLNRRPMNDPSELFRRSPYLWTIRSIFSYRENDLQVWSISNLNELQMKALQKRYPNNWESDIFSLPIKRLPLSTQAIIELYNQGIFYIGELALKTEAELSSLFQARVITNEHITILRKLLSHLNSNEQWTPSERQKSALATTLNTD